jgi:hypothetical protein
MLGRWKWCKSSSYPQKLLISDNISDPRHLECRWKDCGETTLKRQKPGGSSPITQRSPRQGQIPKHLSDRFLCWNCYYDSMFIVEHNFNVYMGFKWKPSWCFQFLLCRKWRMTSSESTPHPLSPANVGLSIVGSKAADPSHRKMIEDDLHPYLEKTSITNIITTLILLLWVPLWCLWSKTSIEKCFLSLTLYLCSTVCAFLKILKSCFTDTFLDVSPNTPPSLSTWKTGH